MGTGFLTELDDADNSLLQISSKFRLQPMYEACKEKPQPDITINKQKIKKSARDYR